ncbi:MAG: type III pantothenate kinase [bacterium]|nr:type III pantothenate kinase [bacterium]
MTTPDDITPSGSILAISVGNTNTALAACIDGEPVHRVTMPNTSLDAIAKATAAAAEEHATDIAVLATVNRTVSGNLVHALQATPELQVLQIGVDLGIPLKHTLDDEAIRGTGQDRLLSAVAAFRIARQACVVVDAGTAVTVDFVDGEGTFHGGAIAPGVRMSLRALHDHPDALPDVEFAAPDAEIPYARNTREAMIHGVFYGTRGLVRQLAERYAIAYDAYPTIIATGGDAQALFEGEELIERNVPDLTLRGIALAYTAAVEADA